MLTFNLFIENDFEDNVLACRVMRPDFKVGASHLKQKEKKNSSNGFLPPSRFLVKTLKVNKNAFIDFKL